MKISQIKQNANNGLKEQKYRAQISIFPKKLRIQPNVHQKAFVTEDQRSGILPECVFIVCFVLASVTKEEHALYNETY